MGCQKVLWLVEPGSVEWVTWRDGRSISGKEQAGKSAVREGLPGPGPASGRGTGCLIPPCPFQPSSSESLHYKCC